MIDIKVRKSKRVYTDNPYSIFVTFPYDQKIVDTIRTIEGRRWNSEKKEWELPIKGLETLIINLPEFDFNINGYVDFSEEENESVEIPQNFSFKTSPFKHQVEVLNTALVIIIGFSVTNRVLARQNRLLILQ